MNFKISAAVLALSAASVSAQGLFDIAPNDEASESSSKINYNAGFRVGFDDLINPGASVEQDSAYLSATLGANGVRIDNRTTAEFYLKYAANYHFDKTSNGSNFSNNFFGGMNYTRRINERLRFSSHNHIGYQLEPDYEYGLANTRSLEEYFTWNSNNVFSYGISERFSGQLGLKLDGVNYDDDRSESNRVGYAVFTQGRYQFSEKTVLTGSYRYKAMNNNGRPDSISHIVTVGAEHRVSDIAVFVARAGAQFHDVDGDGADTSSPYVEFAYRSKLNERTSVRSFLRYGITDYDTTFGSTSFDVNKNLRAGIVANHQSTERLKLHGGLDVVASRRSAARVGGVLGGTDVDDEIVHAYVGFSYQIYTDMSVTGTYNHTQSISDNASSDYTRNRYSVGVSYTW